MQLIQNVASGEVLTECLQTLNNSLIIRDNCPLTNHLVAKRVLNDSDHKELNNTPERDKVGKLISILKRKPEEYFDHFLEALNIEHDFLCKELTERIAEKKEQQTESAYHQGKHGSKNLQSLGIGRGRGRGHNTNSLERVYRPRSSTSNSSDLAIRVCHPLQWPDQSTNEAKWPLLTGMPGEQTVRRVDDPPDSSLNEGQVVYSQNTSRSSSRYTYMAIQGENRTTIDHKNQLQVCETNFREDSANNDHLAVEFPQDERLIQARHASTKTKRTLKVIESERSYNINPEATFKMIMAGQLSVGKTTLLQAYLKEGTPNWRPIQPTVSATLENQLYLVNGEYYKVHFYDVPGSENHRNIFVSYFKGCHAAVAVYDVSCGESIDCLDNWLAKIEEHKDRGCEQFPVAIIGNKDDLKETKGIERKLKKLKDKYGGSMQLMFNKTSALYDTKYVITAFEELINRKIEQYMEEQAEQAERRESPERVYYRCCNCILL